MSAKITFRQARRDEVPQVVALLSDDLLGQGREVPEMTTYLAAYDRMIAVPGNRIYVGVQEDAIVATYQLTIIDGLSRTAARRAQIEAVRVSTASRGQGIGHLMLADIEARARAAGCVLIQLTSDARRTEARRFYADCGYLPSHIGFKKPLT